MRVPVFFLLVLSFINSACSVKVNNSAALAISNDHIPPIVSVSFLSQVKGGSSSVITFSAIDPESGVSTLSLDYSIDMINYVKIADLDPALTTYSWSVPTANTALAILKIRATDAAGNSADATTSRFTIDSIAPNAPVVTLNSASLTTSSAIFSVAGCTDTATILLNVGTTPSGSESGWQSCTTLAGALSYTLSTEGLNAVQAWAKDGAGNISSVSNTVNVTRDSTIPTLSLTSLTGGQFIVGGVTTSISWTSTDLNFGATPITIEVSSDSGSTWSIEAGHIANTSPYSWTPPSTNSATYKIRITSVDTVGNSITVTSSTFTIDSIAPTLTGFSVNAGAVYTGSPIVSATANLSDNFSAGGTLSLRVKEANLTTGDCQSEYANDLWQTWNDATTTVTFVISSGDGTKKLCGWAKDQAGNVSSILAPSTGTQGVNLDTIEFQVGNPPQITAFSVTNNNNASTTYTAGDPVHITWTTTDAEGLDNNPITLEYTTNNSTWTSIVANYGSQSGNPITYTGSYDSFTAPVSTYFQLRITSKDAAGNTSIRITSNAQNTPNWSIYAGSIDRGVGLSGRSARLYGDGSNYHIFAVSPVSGDVYAIDLNYGIKKLDAKTGIVSTFLTSGGSTNGTGTLGSAGNLPASPTIPLTGINHIHFDSKGRLYVNTTTTGYQYYSTTIYQFDVTQSPVTYRKYIGGITNAGGNVASNWDSAQAGGLTTTSTFVYSGNFRFDEDDSIYFLTRCSAIAYAGTNGTIPALRVLKMTQNTDGTPGVVSIFAGNCTNAVPANATVAVNQAFTALTPYNTLLDFEVWNHGNTFYYSYYVTGFPVFKILNGTTYTTAITGTSGALNMRYDAIHDRMYYTKLGQIQVDYITPSLTGANGDTVTNLIPGTNTSSCTQDGIAPSAACLRAGPGIDFSKQGTLFLGDGSAINSFQEFRIRYIDSSNKMQTVMGTQPFVGNGLQKGLITGSIAGVYYKKATESNLGAYPEGLYFMDKNGMTFNYADPNTGIVTTLWGNQYPWAATYNVGTVVSSSNSMGAPYGGGYGYPLAFDSTGLPWLRYSGRLVSLDSNRAIVNRMVGSTWPENMPHGTGGASDPINAISYVYSTMENIALNLNRGIAHLGGYESLPGTAGKLVMGYFDFTNGSTIKHIAPEANGLSRTVVGDITTPGAVYANGSVSASCMYNTCYIQFRADQDRIYFTEWNRTLRFVSSASDRSLSTLETLFTAPAGVTIRNFIFSLDNSQVFYMDSNGGLRCHDLSSGKAWCDDTLLGPVTGIPGISTSATPNQLTWKDSAHLIISTYTGYILQYDLLP